MSFPIKLSEHFSTAEMTVTETRKYLEENRHPPDSLLPAAEALCTTLLEPLRVHFNAPVVVHSAYRCAKLNKAIGGSKTSQHQFFQAADFHVQGMDLTETWEWIGDNLASGGRVGQCILEGHTTAGPSWIHISLGAPYRALAKCGQMMTFDGSKYVIVRTVK